MNIRSWRFYAVCVALVLAIIYILPTLNPGLWPHKTINLGLDLQGGMHLVLDVQVEEVLESTLERRIYELRDQMRRERIPYSSVRRVPDGSIAVSLVDIADADILSAFHEKQFADMDLQRVDINQEVEFRFSIPAEERTRLEKMATDQALETIRNRIDQFGVNEPDIRLQGDRRILIQLPGIKDPKRAKELIGKTALLEFRIVEDGYDVQNAIKGQLPPGTELIYEINKNGVGEEIGRTRYLVKKRAALTGDALIDARVQFDSRFNEPYVAIDFDKQGARQFDRITGENIHKRMAIVLDGNVYSAPVIQDRISGGSASITGNFSMESAHDLAIILRAGALPAPVNIIEERTVGPTLGADSIKKGLLSIAVGGCLVLIFMAFYYKGAGLIADIALALNILFIGAALAAFGATLTLPGIAGIVLTIGMAVDANVLVFERIREEIRLGRSPMAAINAGFDRATLTILDANVTTFLATLVLFQFGTGPIKGFAVTLSLGVLFSMFTSLVVVRLIFNIIYGRKTTPTQLSI